jgi:hypothetical protein
MPPISPVLSKSMLLRGKEQELFEIWKRSPTARQAELNPRRAELLPTDRHMHLFIMPKQEYREMFQER